MIMAAVFPTGFTRRKATDVFDELEVGIDNKENWDNSNNDDEQTTGQSIKPNYYFFAFSLSL